MGCCFCWSKTDRNKIIVSFVFVYQFYLNWFESFSDQLIILTGELLEIGIVELGVRIAFGTNVPENILLIRSFPEEISLSIYLLLNTLCLSLQDPNAPSMKPVLAILTANVKPKQNAFLSLGNICIEWRKLTENHRRAGDTGSRSAHSPWLICTLRRRN